MEEDGALFDSGFDDTGPFRVSPESGSVSLESALRDFGPAAIDDLIPRVRAIAAILDAAHRANVVHGALHLNKVFVSDTSTYVIAGKGASFDPSTSSGSSRAQSRDDSAQGKQRPYAAPEVLDGHGATPMSDQYSLAAITYEWLFGRAIARPADRPVEVGPMPGVDRSALSKAFTRALAPKPEDRFASCTAFCDAMQGAIVPELPLLAGVEDFHAEEDLGAAPIAAAPAADGAASFESEDGAALLAGDRADVDDLKIITEEPDQRHAGFEAAFDDGFRDEERSPDLHAIDPGVSEPPPMAVPAWTPAAHAPARSMQSQRFGAFALILATLVGAVFGFAAGYMALPRALQTGAPQQITVTPGTDAPIAGAAKSSDTGDTRDAGEKAASKKSPGSPVPPVPPASPGSPASPAAVGRLLVRSNPSGASVTVDGVARGNTPLALRDLAFGTRDVTITRRGYLPENRKITISTERPARTVDVRLSAAAAPKPIESAPRPSTPATFGKSATTGSLAIESRPSGASVTINGKPSGTTPLTINDLAPGEYRILMSMTGYRNLATTVRVVAGERARAAASLTALEQE